MRDWRRVLFAVGGMWLVTWAFWLAGFHTPMSFAVALVGCTGMALVWACAWDTFGPERR